MASICMISLFGCSGKSASTENETINQMSPESKEEVEEPQDTNSYLSDIFVSDERQIWYYTYGIAKDSTIEQILIAENGYLTYADSDYTLGDIAQMTEDDVYTDTMTKMKNFEIAYAKYDTSKMKLICQTDSTGNNVTDETILIDRDALASFYLNPMDNPSVEVFTFHVNTGAGPNNGHEVAFSPATVYDTNFQYYSFGKLYLLSALGTDETPKMYYTDDANELMASSIIKDKEAKDLYSSAQLPNGTEWGFSTPDGQTFIFDNLSEINSNIYFPEGSSIVAGSEANNTESESSGQDGNNAVYAPEGNEGSSFYQDADGDGIDDRFQGNAGGL